MDLSRLRPAEAIGALASILLIVSVFLTWFSLTDTPERQQQGDWICGTGNIDCTAWGTFPLMRFLLIAAAAAPLILAWIVIRGHTLSWPPGQLTMVVGLTAGVLILVNGWVSRPGDFGVDLAYGYHVGFFSAVGIAAAGLWRSFEAGGAPKRRPPGTF